MEYIFDFCDIHNKILWNETPVCEGCLEDNKIDYVKKGQSIYLNVQNLGILVESLLELQEKEDELQQMKDIFIDLEEYIQIIISSSEEDFENLSEEEARMMVSNCKTIGQALEDILEQILSEEEIDE